MVQAYELMQQQIPTAMQWLHIKADDFVAANNLSAVSLPAFCQTRRPGCNIQAVKACDSSHAEYPQKRAA